MRLLAMATAMAIVAMIAPASTAQANHAWNNYHWARTSNPFTVRLDNNVSSAWTSYLNTASADWTASSVLNTTVQSGSFGSPQSCSPITGHVEVCSANYGSTGWLGVASISLTTGNHISRGLAAVNDFYFNQAQYNTPAYRRLVMCQEVGHAFGLGHQDENQTNPNLGTCMDYTRDPDGPPSNEHPNSHDYSQLQSIYSHLDSFNTPTAGPSLAGTPLASQSPANWGTLVHGSAAHGEGIYLRSHGNGNYTITFVTWA
jgi:hypothetical protein